MRRVVGSSSTAKTSRRRSSLAAGPSRRHPSGLRLLVLGIFLVTGATAREQQRRFHSPSSVIDDLPLMGPRPKVARLPTRTTVVTASYVILLEDLNDLSDVIGDYGFRPLEVYRHVLEGFAVEDVSDTVFDALLADPRIALVAEDGILDDEQDDGNNTQQQQSSPPPPPPVQTQSPAVWHLDRLDGKGGDLRYDYRYDGTDVHVYVLDSGIRATHREFRNDDDDDDNRVATPCFDGVGPCRADDDSHGTHVAGLVGGRAYGVAKGVTLHDVRIRDVHDDLRWAYLYAAWDHVVEERRRHPRRKMIVNVSYSGGQYDVADRAAAEAVRAGILMIAAAGNQGDDACQRTPARVPGVIAVGSMAEGDVRAASSNVGRCIDIWAPGRDIVSAGITSDGAVQTKSGTSMAAPLVSGVLAMYLQAGWTLENLLADAEYVDALADDVTTGRLVSVRRLIEGGTRSPTASPTMTPTASHTASPTIPTDQPTDFPTFAPLPTFHPTLRPTRAPTEVPSERPSTSLRPSSSFVPSRVPTQSPTETPSDLPSMSLQPSSSSEPSLSPTTSQIPSAPPSVSLTPTRTRSPTFVPAELPRAGGTGGSAVPTATPTEVPAIDPPASLTFENTIDRSPSSAAATTAPADQRAMIPWLALGLAVGWLWVI